LLTRGRWSVSEARPWGRAGIANAHAGAPARAALLHLQLSDI